MCTRNKTKVFLMYASWLTNAPNETRWISITFGKFIYTRIGNSTIEFGKHVGIEHIQRVRATARRRRKNNHFQPWSWQWISMCSVARQQTIESICITLVNVRIIYLRVVPSSTTTSLSSSPLLLLYFFCFGVVACFFTCNFSTYCIP